jgi:hypothetical protein
MLRPRTGTNRSRAPVLPEALLEPEGFLEASLHPEPLLPAPDDPAACESVIVAPALSSCCRADGRWVGRWCWLALALLVAVLP